MKKLLIVIITCLSLFTLGACKQKEIVVKDEMTALGRKKEDIQKYLQEFNKDKANQISRGAIFSTHSTYDTTGSYDNLKNFINKVNNNEETSTIFVSLTDEGDFIYNYVNYNGKDYYVLNDSEYDKFGNYGIKEKTGKYLVCDEKDELSYVMVSDLNNLSCEGFMKLVLSSNSKDRSKLEKVYLWVIVDHK